MAIYFGMRIRDGYLQYINVVAKYPQFKADIDLYLTKQGREDLIVSQ